MGKLFNRKVLEQVGITMQHKLEQIICSNLGLGLLMAMFPFYLSAGFRETILALQWYNSKRKNPGDLLQWMFRVFDESGRSVLLIVTYIVITMPRTEKSSLRNFFDILGEKFVLECYQSLSAGSLIYVGSPLMKRRMKG